MKLRILGNSLRLRLSIPEVEDLGKDMHVSDSIDFGDQKLIYSLQGSDVEEITANFNGNFITVDVPRPQLMSWIKTDLTGINNSQKLDSGTELSILIEKDFACPTRPDEDDKFPNQDVC